MSLACLGCSAREMCLPCMNNQHDCGIEHTPWIMSIVRLIMIMIMILIMISTLTIIIVKME